VSGVDSHQQVMSSWLTLNAQFPFESMQTDGPFFYQRLLLLRSVACADRAQVHAVPLLAVQQYWPKAPRTTSSSYGSSSSMSTTSSSLHRPREEWRYWHVALTAAFDTHYAGAPADAGRRSVRALPPASCTGCYDRTSETEPRTDLE